MATPVQLLQLSPTMSDGTIVKWLVKEGDKVSAGDPIAEIETDKAVMEQESFEDGTVLKLLAKEGESVPVGSEIAMLGAEGESYSASAAAPAKKEAKAEEAKPAAKAEAPAAGKAEAPAAAPASAPARAEGERVHASPLARKMAKEEGLDIAAVSGSGPNGRVVKRDIEKALAGGGAKAAPAAAAPAPAPVSMAQPVAVPVASGDEEIALGGMRKTIARRLLQSRQTIPSFSVTVEVNAQPLLDAVAALRAKELPEKITVTHLMIKAMASTLMKHPAVRTQWAEDKMIRKAGAHISVAVAIDEGLLTPVIRDCHGKGLVQIAAELRELAGKARERRLSEGELSGGVQTISNLGMYGVSNFDAIINPPESSILAVGAVEERPVVRNGALAVGKVFSVTMSSDHRVVDGAVAASYLKDLKAALEDPLLILA